MYWIWISLQNLNNYGIVEITASITNYSRGKISIKHHKVLNVKCSLVKYNIRRNSNKCWVFFVNATKK